MRKIVDVSKYATLMTATSFFLYDVLVTATSRYINSLRSRSVFVFLK